MAFSDDGVSYFYASGRSNLADQTMVALYGRKFDTKQRFLDEFTKGHYLVDMAKCPINRLRTPAEKKAKKKALISCAKYLNEELGAMNFKRVVFIEKKSFGTIEGQLDLRHLNYAVIPLPFRSKKNIDAYRRGLRKAVRSSN